ncbi:hypothetical protein [Scytonema sp. NUACC26]
MAKTNAPTGLSRSFNKIKWQQLEEQIYGVPVYKQMKRQHKQAKELTW